MSTLKNRALDFALEEYKFAKERIRKTEALMYQIITLNITAYGLILGISNVDRVYLPLILSSITLVCAKKYIDQSNRQTLTAAYIIDQFESNIDEIGYESMLGIVDRVKKQPSNWFLKKVYHLRRNSIFLMLGLVSLGFLLSHEYGEFSDYVILNILYVGLNILMHFYLFYSISSFQVGVTEYKNKLEEIDEK